MHVTDTIGTLVTIVMIGLIVIVSILKSGKCRHLWVIIDTKRNRDLGADVDIVTLQCQKCGDVKGRTISP